MTDSQGNVISRRDFLPFGEQLDPDVGGRTENLKYSLNGSDSVRKRFTGYEKDEESGLDFAEARMYQNRHGRFTASDPLLSSVSLGNPQTFNRYVYVGNNPVNVTDPSGLDWCVPKGGGEARFAGAGVACGSLERRVTTATAVRSNGLTDSNGVVVHDGDNLNLHDDGRVTVSRPSNDREVANAGVQIQGSANPESTVSAPTGEVSSDITLRQTDPGPDLGCPEGSDSACGSGNVPVSPSLDTSNNEPLKTVEAIDKIATLLQLIPLTSAPASIIKIVIAAGRGDTMSAGENLAMSIPFVAPIKRLGTVVKAADEVAEGSYIVYQGINPATKAIEYVGITSRELLIRAGEHKGRDAAKAGLQFVAVDGAKNLTKIQARVWEQKLINKYGLENLQNRINSIASKYWSQYGIGGP